MFRKLYFYRQESTDSEKNTVIASWVILAVSVILSFKYWRHAYLSLAASNEIGASVKKVLLLEHVQWVVKPSTSTWRWIVYRTFPGYLQLLCI
jgi:hypothetical protein